MPQRCNAAKPEYATERQQMNLNINSIGQKEATQTRRGRPFRSRSAGTRQGFRQWVFFGGGGPKVGDNNLDIATPNPLVNNTKLKEKKEKKKAELLKKMNPMQLTLTALGRGKACLHCKKFLITLGLQGPKSRKS